MSECWLRMDDTNAISLAKRTMRQRMRESLAAMTDVERRDASGAVCGRIAQLRSFQAARVVMLYLPLPGEVDCTPLIEQALHDGKTVCVPQADWDNRAMLPVRLCGLAEGDCVISRHGVRVPARIDPIAIEAILVVIVPGLAFDERGHRLGRGGGFYDRFLARLAPEIPTIALAFERQIVSEIPAAPHDARVQFVATERRMIDGG